MSYLKSTTLPVIFRAPIGEYWPQIPRYRASKHLPPFFIKQINIFWRVRLTSYHSGCDRSLPPRTSGRPLRMHSDGYLSDITPVQVFSTSLPKSKNANLPPPPIQGIQRVDQMVVLGVLIHERLSFKPHIDNVVSRCAQTFYALRVLKSAGLLCSVGCGKRCFDQPHPVCLTFVVGIHWCVWWPASAIFNKQGRETGILVPCPLIELCQQADETLFSGILRNRNHVLHCLLPPEQQTGYTLRPRAHDRSRLPGDVNPLLRQNFIYRSLSNNFFYSN